MSQTVALFDARAKTQQHQGMSQPGDASRAAKRKAGPARRIVFLDDSASTREIVKSVLSEAGYIVTTCETWDDTYDAVREHMPDLVLLDVQMPGISGAPVAYILKTYFPSMKVVFFSSCTELSLQLLTKETMADGFIQKSDDPDEIVRAIQQYLQHNAGSGGG